MNSCKECGCYVGIEACNCDLRAQITALEIQVAALKVCGNCEHVITYMDDIECGNPKQKKEFTHLGNTCRYWKFYNKTNERKSD